MGRGKQRWRNARCCYFKWLQEARAPTGVMGFPLHVPQEQDALNMGICLLTYTSPPFFSFSFFFFFLQKEATRWGGWVRQELRDSAFFTVPDNSSGGMYSPHWCERRLNTDRNNSHRWDFSCCRVGLSNTHIMVDLKRGNHFETCP